MLAGYLLRLVMVRQAPGKTGEQFFKIRFEDDLPLLTSMINGQQGKDLTDHRSIFL